MSDCVYFIFKNKTNIYIVNLPVDWDNRQISFASAIFSPYHWSECLVVDLCPKWQSNKKNRCD